MTTATLTNNQTSSGQKQLATFYVADMCLALEIGLIQEIIRDIKAPTAAVWSQLTGL